MIWQKKRKTDKPEIILEGLTEETTEQKLESSGLGDMIASITTAIGIEPYACEREEKKHLIKHSMVWKQVEMLQKKRLNLLKDYFYTYIKQWWCE